MGFLAALVLRDAAVAVTLPRAVVVVVDEEEDEGLPALGEVFVKLNPHLQIFRAAKGKFEKIFKKRFQLRQIKSQTSNFFCTIRTTFR